MIGPLWGFLFATPLTAFLTLAGAASVPVLVHLLNRRRYQIVPWAAMRFLLNAQKQTVRRLKLEQWLLLALRILLVMLIAFAMMAVMPWIEPLWSRFFPGGLAAVPGASRTHKIVVIDASYSMATQAGDAIRWDRAKSEAEQWLRNASPGDGFSVVLMTSPAQMLIAGPVDDATAAINEIRALPVPHGAADVSGGLNLVADILSRSPTKFSQRDVAIFTDMQRASWSLPRVATAPTPESEGPRNSLADAWQQITTRGRAIFIDTANRDVENLAITSLTMGDSLPVTGLGTTITATVQNFGQAERKDVRVTFLIGGAGEGNEAATLRVVEERTIALAPGASSSVTIATTFRSAGDLIVQARLAPDELPVDDVRSLALRVRETVPVIVVNGKPAVDPLLRGSEWLMRALYPFRANAPAVAGYPARPRLLSLADFADAGLGDLSGADAVFFCDVPRFSPAEMARIEAYLQRGGTIVIGMGPNSARQLDSYNKMTDRNREPFFPGTFKQVRTAPENGFFTLLANEESIQLPPLNAFRADNERAALSTPRFRQYVQLELTPRAPVRKLLSFLAHEPEAVNPPKPSPEQPPALDPAWIEWSRARGRVILYTSTFNADWTSWPLSPSFPPFMQELFRHAVTGNVKPSVLVGEPLEEYLPIALAGLDATIVTPARQTVTAPVIARNDGGLLLIPDTDLSGIYRARVGAGRPDALFAVNVPIATQLRGSESDLRRVETVDLLASAPGADIVVVPTINDIPRPSRTARGEDAEGDLLIAVSRGPEIARIVLLALLLILPLEMLLAYRLGAGRASSAVRNDEQPQASWLGAGLRGLFWLLPVAIAFGIFGVLLHEAVTGEFLGFLPDAMRRSIEASFNVPEAAPGEGIRWRLSSLLHFTSDPVTDRWLTLTASGLLLVVVLGFYLAESKLVRERFSWRPARAVWPMMVMRFLVLMMLLLVLLPQLQLTFEREGWPDLVIVLDDSRSMSTVDQFADQTVRDKAAELTRSMNLTEASRLQLAQALVTQGDDWLTRMVRERQMKVHVYRASNQVRQLIELQETDRVAEASEAIAALRADGPSSELDAALVSVLKTFRGGSLAAVVMLTDGVITHDPMSRETSDRTGKRGDFQNASRLASKMGVPLYFVGLGDARQPFDVLLTDLQVEDVAKVNDRIVFEAKLTIQGEAPQRGGETLPVILYEKQGEELVERARTQVTLEPSGKPAKVKLMYSPREAGEKVYVLRVPDQAGEIEFGNNRLERVISVQEEKRLRVLYVEGTPRYEYRFIKTLLERETDQVRGNKTIDLNVFLCDAHPEHHEQDKSSLSAFPTKQQLFAYDVVIWGDVDPKTLPNTETNLRDLSEFVKEQGGGLILIAGPNALPRNYFDSTLAGLLPITSDVAAQAPLPDTITETFRPQLTVIGQNHPIFRFAAEDAESSRIWNRLQPMLWYSTGYRRKLSAEVLAVHPERRAESPLNPDMAAAALADERHPLVLQQFVGAGRVLFIGYEESWRWRYRDDEIRFNQFWSQAIRSMMRNRVSRIELRLDRQTAYRKDEPIRVTVRFPEDAPAPAADMAVRVQVERRALTPEQPIAETQTLQLTRREGTRGTYESILTRTPEGLYRFTLTVPEVPTGKPMVETRVLPPPGEMDQLQLNQIELERAASDSQGKFFTLTDANALIDSLPPGRRVALNQPCPPWSLWNQPGLLLLLLAMLGLEWWFRKRLQMV